MSRPEPGPQLWEHRLWRHEAAGRPDPTGPAPRVAGLCAAHGLGVHRGADATGIADKHNSHAPRLTITPGSPRVKRPRRKAPESTQFRTSRQPKPLRPPELHGVKSTARLTRTSGGFAIVEVRPAGEPARTSCSAQGLPSPELDPASLPAGVAVHRTTQRRRSQGTKPRA